jgi:hypothetical protein
MRFLRLFNWKTILLFAAVGPAVGYVVFFVVMMRVEVELKAFDALPFLMFGYFVGFPPALVTGVLFSAVQSGWTLQGPGRTTTLIVAGAMVGAICGALSISLYFYCLGLHRHFQMQTDPLSLGIGACSGAVCAALVCFMEHRRAVR